MYSCVKLKNAENFLEQCEYFLLQNETHNNLILGLADALANKNRPANAPLFYGLYQSEKIVGAALRTDEDKPLSLSLSSPELCIPLLDKIQKDNIELTGVVGEENASQRFAQYYAKASHKKMKLLMHQGVYEARKIITPPHDSAQLVLAKLEHKSVVEEFVRGFIKDCFPEDHPTAGEADEITQRQLSNQSLYLLNNDGNYVAMAANNRETKNSACIGLVYTPYNHRQKGYGSLVTALISQMMLDQGKSFCNLFTDLLNPTSNSIYQKIGYKMIGKSKHFDFI